MRVCVCVCVCVCKLRHCPERTGHWSGPTVVTVLRAKRDPAERCVRPPRENWPGAGVGAGWATPLDRVSAGGASGSYIVSYASDGPGRLSMLLGLSPASQWDRGALGTLGPHGRRVAAEARQALSPEEPGGTGSFIRLSDVCELVTPSELAVGLCQPHARDPEGGWPLLP